MHGIGHDTRLCFLNDTKINQRLDVVEVLLSRADFLDSLGSQWRFEAPFDAVGSQFL